jgi:hypothetical protein
MINKEKLKINLYHNESREALKLEQELQARGYELKVFHCSRKEPAILAPTFSLNSWRDICDVLNVYPFER